jgi:hypothetical protein
MITVYKYQLGVSKEEVSMPVGAEVISAAFQSDTLCLWAKVDTEATTEFRRFKVFGTGHEIDPKFEGKLKFIDTAFIGMFVFHVFEVI